MNTITLPDDMPELPIWQARSFYASGLLVAVVICNAMGVDLMGFLAAMGFGNTESEVIANLQTLAPMFLGLWAWFERRAPKFRLAWKFT